MKKDGYSSRRDFLRKSAIAAGVASVTPYGIAAGSRRQTSRAARLPREVWVTALSQMDLFTKTPESMRDEIFRILRDNVTTYKPDIICLPEVFHCSNVEQVSASWEERLKITGSALQQFSVFAKENNCYIICPVYTSENGKIYNAAVILDRAGSRLGEYRKIHLTEGEIADGMTPGPLDPPVFETDFGRIGIQICFDIEWDDGWKRLSEKGAEIVFFPSAFAAGDMVNAKAWQNMYPVVSSTRKDTARVCDLTGKVIAETGRWNVNLVCAPVNLEKVFLHTWPDYQHFADIQKKYGRKIQITNFHEEEWSIIESLSPDVRVADILKEYNLKSKRQLLQDAERAQSKARAV